LYKNLKYLGGWAGKSAMADTTTTTARLIGHMTYTQAPAVHEKNIFHLFRFTQPVKNYSYFLESQPETPLKFCQHSFSKVSE